MSYFYKDTIEKIQKLRFIEYLRRSSKDNEDRQVRSIPGQLNDLNEKIIIKYGLKRNVASILKESKSAFTLCRPYFNEMLERIENEEADAIIVWHPNRLARNYGDGGRLVQLMSEGKLKMVLTLHSIFENNARDKEYLMTEFTRATRDSDDKSEAVKRGNRERFFEKKQWIGPAKPGYLNFTDPITKEKPIIEDKDRFPLLQRGVKSILSGVYTPMEALYKLNNEWGYRSRKTARQGDKPLSKSGWYRILSDPYLYGLLVRKEGKIMSDYKRMITKEEFDRLQILLGRKGRPHNTKHDFPFKGPLKCGECGASITIEEKWQIICPRCKTKFHKGKATNNCPKCQILIEEMKNPTLLHYVYLHCTKKKHPNCTQKSIRMDKLEEQIDNELKKFEICEEFKNWAIEHLGELNTDEEKKDTIVKNNFLKQYKDTDKQLKNLVKLRISPEFANYDAERKSLYDQEEKQLIQAKKDFKEKINKSDKNQEKWIKLCKDTFDFACYARYWFANGDAKTKTYVLSKLGSNLTIKDKNLVIDGAKPWFLIEKGKKEVENLALKLEPEKSLDILIKTDLVEPLRSCWLGS